MVPFWMAFPAGICIATIVTIVGFGGGLLWMPFLLMALSIDPATALLTSLLIQIAGTASGSYAYVRNKKADVRLAVLLLTVGLPGLALGAYIGSSLTLTHIGLFIGMVSLGTALLFVSSNHRYGDEGNERVELRKAGRHSWIAGVMAVMCGMLTINIGEWLVPVMQKKMHLKMSNSVATCVMITCGMSILGAAAHFLMSSKPNLTAMMWGIPGVLIGGQIGPLLITKIDERQLKEVFVFLLTLIGVHLVYRSYPG
ncbi:MAG: sulfite exporter TauE/SafE family protein [Syntrophobacteraceae bacterium]